MGTDLILKCLRLSVRQLLTSVTLCASSGSPCPLLPLPGNSRYKLSSADVPDMVSYPLPQSSSSYSAHAPSSVAMVSGLHSSKMNCTRIFNLFCLYGNIEKVRGVCDCSLFHATVVTMVSHQPQLLGGLGEGVTHNVTMPGMGMCVCTCR